MRGFWMFVVLVSALVAVGCGGLALVECPDAGGDGGGGGGTSSSASSSSTTSTGDTSTASSSSAVSSSASAGGGGDAGADGGPFFPCLGADGVKAPNGTPCAPGGLVCCDGTCFGPGGCPDGGS